MKITLTAVIVLVAAIAAIASLVFYLYTAKKYLIHISDDKMLASDGKGPYEEGVDGIQAYSVSSSDFDKFIIVMGSRFVWINFSDAHWMNGSMADLPPVFSSKRYGIDFVIGAVLSKMNIGEHQSPTISIELYDANTARLLSLFDIVYAPLSLRQQNRIDLARESQDKWSLDVDAWFMGIKPEDRPYGPKYYVKISFTMTIETVPSYKL